MRKEIKKWGESAVIVLPKEELKLYGLSIGDIIEVTIIKYEKEVKNGNFFKEKEGFQKNKT